METLVSEVIAGTEAADSVVSISAFNCLSLEVKMKEINKISMDLQSAFGHFRRNQGIALYPTLKLNKPSASLRSQHDRETIPGTAFESLLWIN